MNSTKSTKQNSLKWRIYHGTMYLLASMLFFAGSIAHFKSLIQFFDGLEIGAYLFSIGSIFYIAADIMEWNHFRFGCLPIHPDVKQCKDVIPFMGVGLIFLFQIFARYLYLMAAILYIPQLEFYAESLIVFVIASILVCLCEFLKIYNKIVTVSDDLQGVLVIFFSIIGSIIYIVGLSKLNSMRNQKVIMYDPEKYPNLVFLICVGGLSYFASGLFLQMKYYVLQHQNDNVTFQNLQHQENGQLKSED